MLARDLGMDRIEWAVTDESISDWVIGNIIPSLLGKIDDPPCAV